MTEAELSMRETIGSLSDQLIEAQRPIRILDAIRWDDSVKQAFFATGCKEPPLVRPDYYAGRRLDFDLDAKRQELQSLGATVRRELGAMSAVGGVLMGMCDEYLRVMDLLEARGTPEFARLSVELYGSANDTFHAGGPTLADLGDSLAESLGAIDTSDEIETEPKTIPAEDAVRILQRALDQTFDDDDLRVRVIVDDGIAADAAAGSDYIKLRADAKFNMRELRLLEVHEGWVHVGTTLNGRAQPVCRFLSKGPPSSTVTQEGLAVLTEVFTGATNPGRLRKLAERVRAVALAEGGANFVEVFDHFREQGFSKDDSWAATARVYRGSTSGAGPFTKDLSYTRGFVQMYAFVRLAIINGRLDRVPLLFVGKTAIRNMGVLGDLLDQGLVEPPRFVPGPFQDLNPLASWMCFSNFLARLDPEVLSADYGRLL